MPPASTQYTSNTSSRTWSHHKPLEQKSLRAERLKYEEFR